MSDIRTFVDRIFDELVAIRRDIHAHPETGMRETRTAALIRSELEKMGVDEIQQPLPTAVVALIHGKKGAGKCVALRADIDALPVHEETGLPFASVNEGVMHACGHDLHTTMLLGAARTLCHMRDQFAGTVKLIFEPSEDLMPGGARALVAAGVMESPHVDAIFGQHVCPSENDSVGRMQLYKGYFTSAVDLFHIAVHGKSGHGAAPHTAHDAIACAGYLITVLQTVVSRRIDPMDTAVLTVGTMSGGDAVNITAGEARMVAVLRSFSDTGRDTAIQEVQRICKGIGIAFDCSIEVELEEGYRLLLASHSPRRQQLLRDCGLDYTLIDRYDVEERYPAGLPPHDVPLFLSQLKSDAYPEPLAANDILLTADTVVVAAGGILGKPHDRDEAVGMLHRLSGAEHFVTTGVTLRTVQRRYSFAVTTAVRFRALADEEIAYYVDRFRPFDKAGGYGIQEWIGYVAIESINGSFYNVMGLPVQRLYVELDRFLSQQAG